MPAALTCVVKLESPNESKSRSHWRVMGAVWRGISDKNERSRTRKRLEIWYLESRQSHRCWILNECLDNEKKNDSYEG